MSYILCFVFEVLLCRLLTFPTTIFSDSLIHDDFCLCTVSSTLTVSSFPPAEPSKILLYGQYGVASGHFHHLPRPDRSHTSSMHTESYSNALKMSVAEGYPLESLQYHMWMGTTRLRSCTDARRIAPSL